MAESRFQAKDPLTRDIIGAAIAVHKELWPGVLESAYASCMKAGLTARGIEFEMAVPVVYRDICIACAYRMDLLVAASSLSSTRLLKSFRRFTRPNS